MTEFKNLGPGNPATIEDFESGLGFTLPLDYKAFLTEHNGARFKSGNHFWVEELKTEEDLDLLYGLFEGHSDLDLRSIHKEMTGEIPAKSLIIGRTSGGGLIVLLPDGLALYDHAHDYRQSSEAGNAYRIAHGFTELLEMLT